jgi:hypothetical protein
MDGKITSLFRHLARTIIAGDRLVDFEESCSERLSNHLSTKLHWPARPLGESHIAIQSYRLRPSLYKDVYHPTLMDPPSIPHSQLRETRMINRPSTLKPMSRLVSVLLTCKG